MRGNGPVSRSELASVSGLSKPTVGLALASLERDELVQPAGRRAGSRGRSALLYEIRRDAGFVLGLDVGRRFVRGAVADLGGTVRAPREPARTLLERLGPRARARGRWPGSSSQDAGVNGNGRLLQTVVGSPGSRRARTAARCSSLRTCPGWERPAVLRDLRRLLGAETTIENDVDAAAVAERDHGHGRDVSTFAFVSVGTGIGMGLILDGKLHRGAHGAAGEIAFLPLAGRRAGVRGLRPPPS